MLRRCAWALICDRPSWEAVCDHLPGLNPSPVLDEAARRESPNCCPRRGNHDHDCQQTGCHPVQRIRGHCRHQDASVWLELLYKVRRNKPPRQTPHADKQTKS